MVHIRRVLFSSFNNNFLKVIVFGSQTDISMALDDRYLKSFNAVITFVHDLWDVFGNPKKATPLALYRRLIEHIKFADAEAINKVLCGFRQFLVTYEDSIINNNLDSIPRGTLIQYGDSNTVYLDIQK